MDEWAATLTRLITETTTPYRKGDEVREQAVGGLRVTTIDAMPALPTDQPMSEMPADLVDVHFVWVAVQRATAEARKPELMGLLAMYPDLDKLAHGPSYIELGGVLGDQGLALRLIALGGFLRLWRVMIPATFGVTGPRADEMAGQGFVMCTGWRP
jgi:hypothetical protein